MRPMCSWNTASQHERKTRVQLPYLWGPHVLTMQDLSELVVELASRPGHEKVRVLLHRLLVDGLGADSQDIYFERPVPEVRGRVRHFGRADDIARKFR